MIDILVPVLSRPQNAAILVDSIRAVTKTPYSILFLCSPGDDEQIDACNSTGAKVAVMLWEASHADYPRKMNFGYKATSGKYMLMGADDLTFLEGWDTAALKVAEETGVGVIGTNDCANKHVMRGYFSTHPLIRRSYIRESGGALEGPGILFSESYDHNYCDRELCHLAQSRDQYAFAPDSRIKHRHPAWRTATSDATYEKGRKTAHEDHLNFFARCVEWGYTGILPHEKRSCNRALRRRQLQDRMSRKRSLG